MHFSFKSLDVPRVRRAVAFFLVLALYVHLALEVLDCCFPVYSATRISNLTPAMPSSQHASGYGGNHGGYGLGSRRCQDEAKWWGSKDAQGLVRNTARAAKEKDMDEWTQRYGSQSRDPWENDGYRRSGSGGWGSGGTAASADRWGDAWKDNGYGRASTYKDNFRRGPYPRSEDDSESVTSKRSSRSTIKVPRGSGSNKRGGASSEASWCFTGSAEDGHGDGKDCRSRVAGGAGDGSDSDDQWAPSPEASEGRPNANDYWNVKWTQGARRSRFMEEATEGTFLGRWYESIRDALGQDFDPNAGYIPTYWGGAGAAGAIETCRREANEAELAPPQLDYVCSCCGRAKEHKSDLAQMMISTTEAQQLCRDSPMLVPFGWPGHPNLLRDAIETRPELAPCGWPRKIIREIVWSPFEPEAFSVKRAIRGEELPNIGHSKLGSWRLSYVSDMGTDNCLIGVCQECFEMKMPPPEPFTSNTWNKFSQRTRYSEKDLKNSIFTMLLQQARKENPGKKFNRKQNKDIRTIAKEIANACRGEDLVALAHASDWSPRVADNMFLLYTCPVCRKACVNQGGWWITYTESGRRCFRCPFCAEPFAYGDGYALRLLALSFFGTPSSAFTCYLGSIPTALDNDLRYVKMALLYNKLGDRSLTHLAMVIEEMNFEAISWFEKMGLGKVGVSCDVHRKIADEGREGIETVLMTDHRLMCDVAGKELLYVETNEVTTRVLGPKDLAFLLLLLWGHLDVERLDLDGITFVDPREAGCEPDQWGPAARKSRDRHVEEYKSMKRENAGTFKGIGQRIGGLMSRLAGNAPAEEVTV